MFVKIDDDVKLYDEVTILGDEITLGQLSRLNEKSIQETLVGLSSKLSKIYIKNHKVEKIL